MTNPEQKNIEIQLSDDVAHGVFSNLAILNHTDAEFVMDFVYLQPTVPKGKVRARIIMTPGHVKRFVGALNDNLKKYEQKYGTIQVHNQISAADVQLGES